MALGRLGNDRETKTTSREGVARICRRKGEVSPPSGRTKEISQCTSKRPSANLNQSHCRARPKFKMSSKEALPLSTLTSSTLLSSSSSPYKARSSSSSVIDARTDVDARGAGWNASTPVWSSKIAHSTQATCGWSKTHRCQSKVAIFDRQDDAPRLLPAQRHPPQALLSQSHPERGRRRHRFSVRGRTGR